MRSGWASIGAGRGGRHRGVRSCAEGRRNRGGGVSEQGLRWRGRGWPWRLPGAAEVGSAQPVWRRRAFGEGHREVRVRGGRLPGGGVVVEAVLVDRPEVDWEPDAEEDVSPAHSGNRREAERKGQEDAALEQSGRRGPADGRRCATRGCRGARGERGARGWATEAAGESAKLNPPIIERGRRNRHGRTRGSELSSVACSEPR